MANRWAMNSSYAYNNAIDNWGSADAYEDPTNIDLWNGYQYRRRARAAAWTRCSRTPSGCSS